MESRVQLSRRVGPGAEDLITERGQPSFRFVAFLFVPVLSPAESKPVRTGRLFKFVSSVRKQARETRAANPKLVALVDRFSLVLVGI